MSGFKRFSALSPEEVAREAYIKKTITETLGLALKTLQQKHVNSEEPIYSEDSANTVCNILEAVFLHGLKPSFSHKLSSYLIGVDHSKTRQPSYWEMLTKFSHKDIVSQLNHLGQITTEIGMCRAWLRVALNDGLLESYLDAMLADKGTLQHFYKRTAYLRDEEHAGILKSYSQGIQNFRFQLSYNSSVLNIWTTTPLVLAGLVEQTVTPRAAMASSVNESTKSQLTATAAAAEETTTTAEDPIVSEGRRVDRHKSIQRVIVSTGSYSSGLGAAAVGEGTSTSMSPADTPGTLTQTEIDEIRQFTEQHRGSPSTPTSQISFPDYAVEGRFTSPEGATSSERSSSRSPTGAKHTSQGQNRVTEIPIKEEVVEIQNDTVQGQHTSGQGQGQDETTKTQSQRPTELGAQRSTELPRPHPPHETSSSMSSLSPVSGSNTPTDCSRSPVRSSTTQELVQELLTGNNGTIVPIATVSSTSSHAPIMPPLQRRKSAVVLPTLSSVTAKVEVAREMSPTIQLGSASGSDQDSHSGADTQPYGIYDEYGPSPQGNALGTMQGWSSEFQQPEVPPGTVKEERPAEVLLHREISLTGSVHESSYKTLLQSYTPGQQVEATSMSQVLETLSSGADSPDELTLPTTVSAESFNKPDTSVVEEYDYPEDYDVLPINLNVTSDHADAPSVIKTYKDKRTQQLVALIGQICNEKGLDQQNYQCNGCSRPIGMIYGKARDCAYDGCYYCYECHENEEAIIPSRIVHNWDFSKYKVARHTLRFLTQIEEDPLLNIQHINPRLYEHVPEMKEVKEVRIQLRFLKAYLFTCKQSVADDLRRQVWPREYLYEDIHVYSISDLMSIQNGQLIAVLRKVIKFASKHVYDCRLCSQKGFICEVCNSSKVIYPFEAETTCRCEQCNAVYHKDCKPLSSQCPKCERRRQRQMSFGSEFADPDPVDYSFVPE